MDNKKSYCNVCWKSCFLKIHKIDDIKLKWLQMRIVHRVIATNVILKKMGIINFEQCTFCDEKDSIELSCGSATLPDAFGDY